MVSSEAEMSKRILIIANPVSGRGKGLPLSEGVRHALEGHGCQVETRLTTPQANGRDLARDLQPDDWDAIVVIGGDGSANDVLCGLDGAEIPIAVMPAGTANVWAHEAGLPANPAAFADLVIAGRTIEIDLGWVNDAPFFLFASVGTDARIVRAVQERRKKAGGRGGFIRWIAPGIRALLGRQQADLTVRIGDRTMSKVAQIIVTRVRNYGGFMKMPSNIKIADDRLHVLTISQRSRLRFFWVVLRAALGRLRTGPGVTYTATREAVRIESSGTEPFQRDGDHAGNTPIDIRIDTRQARFIVGRI